MLEQGARERCLLARIGHGQSPQSLLAKLHPYNSSFCPGTPRMAIYELDGMAPQLAKGAWVADNAEVIGQVELAENASVWYGCVVRGDTEKIRVGKNSNIQDGTVLHADAGVPLTIGDNVTVGHQVMLHGCTIGDGSLVGIQAVVLNHAKIGRNCIVGAGSVVTEGKEFPDNSLIVGAPAKAIRTLDAEQIAKFQTIPQHYVENALRHAKRKKIG
jgi:carbonic anhydrase/acetyltransferase-like protein (isoleucine patch superfamily)